MQHIRLPSFIFFSIPVILYWIISKRKGLNSSIIAGNLGFTIGNFRFYKIALFIGIGFLFLGIILYTFKLIPFEWKQFNTNNIPYGNWNFSLMNIFFIFFLEAIFVTLGEEIFFRGFLASWLIRRFGYIAGNAIQSVIFLCFHLPILAINKSLWHVVFLVVPIISWIFGWLLYRSGSLLPGWLLHTLVNTITIALILKYK